MKLNESPQFPQDAVSNSALKNLIKALYDLFRSTNQKTNRMAIGYISEFDSANTVPPTSGLWAQGDFIYNKTPTELGTAGNKYVIEGWVCVVSGEPGTWVQKRTLTGN